MKFKPKLIGTKLSLPERLRYLLDLVRTKQLRKAFHITLVAPIISRILNAPSKLCIEPTSLCNASCVLCSTPQDKLRRRMIFLPLEEFKRIVDQLRHSLSHITFFLAGEPFIHPELCEMISYASRKGIATLVSTNGTLLNAKTIEKLLESNLDKLIVCLDGARKQTHEIYRRGTNFEQVCQAIRELALEKRRRRRIFPYVFIQTLITRYNEDELDELIELGKQLGADGHIFKRLGILECYDDSLAMEFLPRKHGFSRYELVNGRVQMEQGRDVECAFTNTVSILCDGSLALCCYDFNGEYELGNAFSAEIIKLWKSERYISLRKKMKSKQLEMCRKMCGERKHAEEMA